MGDERDRAKATDEPDVEAHRFKVNPDESTDKRTTRRPTREDESTKDDDDTPDVEAHRHKL